MKIVLLPGDCIGPEVAAEARRVLEALLPDVEIEERLFGGRRSGRPVSRSPTRRSRPAAERTQS